MFTHTIALSLRNNTHATFMGIKFIHQRNLNKLHVEVRKVDDDTTSLEIIMRIAEHLGFKHLTRHTRSKGHHYRTFTK